jgi:hypothetical protein
MFTDVLKAVSWGHANEYKTHLSAARGRSASQKILRILPHMKARLITFRPRESGVLQNGPQNMKYIFISKTSLMI